MVKRLLGVAGAAAALVYFLDPARGNRRRALVRDRVLKAAHKTGDAVDTTSRDLVNRARGIVLDLRGRFATTEVSDDVLVERVRARLGAVVGYAASIETTVEDGMVRLRGPVLASDWNRVLRRVRAVRGVRDVEDELDTHEEPGDVPGLQRAVRRPKGGEVFELMQTRWSPAARFLTGSGGILLVVWGLGRDDAIGAAATLSGAALFTRAATNEPLARLAGLEPPRRTRRA